MGKINKKVLVFLLLIALTLVGCDKTEEVVRKTMDNESKSVQLEKGGEINIPLTSIGTLNPIINQNESYYFFSKMVYESLFEINDEFNVEGLLVEDWKIEEAGRTINLKLRDDVYWHDGEKLTAEDVIWTIEVIKNAGSNSIHGDLWENGLGSYVPINIKRIIEATGEGRNLTISFDKAFSNNLEVLTFPVIPKHKFEDVKQALAKNNYPVVGTGPFKFESYEDKKEVALVANEKYRTGRPVLDGVRGKIFKTEDEIKTAFETGQVSMLVAKGSDWEKYTQSDSVTLLEYPSSKYEFLAFNFNKEIFQGERGLGLRRAIGHAVDKKSIMENGYLGHGEITDSPIHPNSWLYSSSVDNPKYDLGKAKKELKNAGWVDKDGEGFLVKEDGSRLSLVLLTNQLNPMRDVTSNIIKQNLENIGIEVRVEPKHEGKMKRTKEIVQQEWLEVSDRLAKGDFDIVISGWEMSPIQDLGFMFHSEEIGRNNFVKYKNEDLDRLLEKAFLDGYSREIKKENYRDVQDKIAEDVPYISLCYRNFVLLMNKNLVGEMKPQFFNPYRGIENISLKKNK